MTGAMPGGADLLRGQLNAAQRRLLERLVGEEVARRDEPAVADAYADFRAAMEGLRREFEGLRPRAGELNPTSPVSRPTAEVPHPVSGALGPTSEDPDR